jgi:FtsP/CotA-like multicopper oxidase with cupredoxin domain
VISIDGISVGRDASDEPIFRDNIVLMPSARMEVLVTHPGAAASGRKAVFRTAGFGTGATPDDGDNWPAIDLAEVNFTTSLTDPEADAGLALVEDGGAAIDLDAGSGTSGDASCPRLAANEVRIVAFDIPSFADDQKPGVDFAVPPGCMADQEYDIIGSVVTALEDDSSYAAILAAYDKAVGDKYASPLKGRPESYRGKCFDGALDTCVPYPSVQDWWVVNASDEGHNFHIHQTRFQVLEVRGENSAYTPIPSIYQDNFPVLAGQAIKVRIALNRPEQIGTFVYHCHILEHEDNGMMAAIEVRDMR